MAGVLSVVGWSGSGKTTLIEKLIPLLQQQGMVLNVMKHTHHDVTFEAPHKDTARFRCAGAQEVVLVSPYRYTMTHELRDQPEPSLDTLLQRLAPCDLVLLEGFKEADQAKIEVHRRATGKAPLYPHDPNIIGVVSDAQLDTVLPTWGLNDVEAVAAFILQWLRKA